MAKQQKADVGTGQNGHEEDVAKYEQELAHYLQERIKPGLNRGSIPLLARSIAKEIAHRRPDEDADVAGEPSNEEDDDVHGEAIRRSLRRRGRRRPSRSRRRVQRRRGTATRPRLEDEMRELQANLGDDWILRVSVQGEDAWLTAEKDDGRQRLEAPTASVLSEAVGLLNEGGGRSA